MLSQLQKMPERECRCELENSSSRSATSTLGRATLVLLHTLRPPLDLFGKIIPELEPRVSICAYNYPGHSEPVNDAFASASRRGMSFPKPSRTAKRTGAG